MSEFGILSKRMRLCKLKRDNSSEISYKRVQLLRIQLLMLGQRSNSERRKDEIYLVINGAPYLIVDNIDHEEQH